MAVAGGGAGAVVFVAAGAAGAVAVSAAGAPVAGAAVFVAPAVEGEALAGVAAVPETVGVSVLELLPPPHAASATAASGAATANAMILLVRPLMLNALRWSPDVKRGRTRVRPPQA